MGKYPFLNGQCVICGRIDATSTWPSSMLLTNRGLECIEHHFPNEKDEEREDSKPGAAH